MPCRERAHLMMRLLHHCTNHSSLPPLPPHHQPNTATLFCVGSYHVGKERFFLGVAHLLGWRVHVSPAKHRVRLRPTEVCSCLARRGEAGGFWAAFQLHNSERLFCLPRAPSRSCCACWACPLSGWSLSPRRQRRRR